MRTPQDMAPRSRDGALPCRSILTLEMTLSDAIDWVVDVDASLEETGASATKVVSWLVSQGIILHSTRESMWQQGRLYEPGPRAAEWSVYVNSGVTQCGLEVVCERTVFHTGDNGLQGFRCPRCSARHEPDALPWSDAVGAWFEAKPDYTLTCPACNNGSPITEWRFLEFEWGFGNLGFGFNNWTITAELVAAISQVLGHQCRLVHEHI